MGGRRPTHAGAPSVMRGSIGTSSISYGRKIRSSGRRCRATWSALRARCRRVHVQLG